MLSHAAFNTMGRGSGGMGDVYRARDTRLDRDVAVKTLKGPFTERFEREARAISSLNHPNICTLHDVDEHEFQTRFATVNVRGLYRPTPDGQRFLVLGPLAREAEQPAAVVLNWSAALLQR